MNPDKPFNIIPIHGGYNCKEIRAVEELLLQVTDLRKPPLNPWLPGMDLLNWVGIFFGFQQDNVNNQREHIVLHLANSQLRSPHLHFQISSFRRKLLLNYTSWCSYTGRRSNIRFPKHHTDGEVKNTRRELLYISLFLLIWGEAADLRFLPECLSFIFHNMAMDLNRILEEDTDDYTGQPYVPSGKGGENYFLNHVISPIYSAALKHCDRHSTSGRINYDDFNELFWISSSSSLKMKWPFDPENSFFSSYSMNKTGFVEHRSLFLNIFRSFDRLWVMLILFLHASLILAWDGGREKPWESLVEKKEIQVKLLTLFITWAGLRFILSVIDIVTQISLVSRYNILFGLRMVLKTTVAVSWIVLFSVFYKKIWDEKGWSEERKKMIIRYLELSAVFMAPELISVVFFFLPQVMNFIEQKDWRVFYMATWWFHVSTFVGRGLREGVIVKLRVCLAK